MNKIFLIGHLGKEPTPFKNGKGCALSVATSETYRSKQTGEWKQDTQWHKVFVRNLYPVDGNWGKGDKVLIEGKIFYKEVGEEPNFHKDALISADSAKRLYTKQEKKEENNGSEYDHHGKVEPF